MILRTFQKFWYTKGEILEYTFNIHFTLHHFILNSKKHRPQSIKIPALDITFTMHLNSSITAFCKILVHILKRENCQTAQHLRKPYNEEHQSWSDRLDVTFKCLWHWTCSPGVMICIKNTSLTSQWQYRRLFCCCFFSALQII